MIAIDSETTAALRGPDSNYMRDCEVHGEAAYYISADAGHYRPYCGSEGDPGDGISA